jgi:hypothetical protein
VQTSYYDVNGKTAGVPRENECKMPYEHMSRNPAGRDGTIGSVAGRVGRRHLCAVYLFPAVCVYYTIWGGGLSNLFPVEHVLEGDARLVE